MNKKAIDTDYSALTEKNETNLKATKFKVNDRVRITKHKKIFSKGYTGNWTTETFIINSLYPWICKIKDLNREKLIGSFYVKEVLGLSKYATKEN